MACLGAVTGCAPQAVSSSPPAAPSEPTLSPTSEAPATPSVPAATVDEAKIPWGSPAGGGGVSVVARSGPMTFYPATSDPVREVSIELEETYTEIARLGAPEQLDNHPAAAVLLVHCSKASGGLAEATQVLLWKVVAADGAESAGELAVPWGADIDAKLIGASLIGSAITASFDSNRPKRYRRIGVSAADRSRIAWVNDSDDDSNLIDPGLVLANSLGQAVMSVPGRILGIDVETGRQIWAKKVPKGSGSVVAESRGHAVVKPYTPGQYGYGTGFALISKDDGAIVTRYQSNSIVIDGAKEWALISYPVIEPGSANEAMPNSAAPALEVVDLKTGRPVFVLSKAAAKGLRGNVLAIGAFDGHALVTVKDGVRPVLAESGQPDPEAPTFPPGTFRLSNVVVASRARWALLGSTNGYGRFETWGGQPDFSGIVRGDSLTASNIPELEAYS